MIINRIPRRAACEYRGYDTCYDPAMSVECRSLSSVCDSYSTENVESLSERGTQNPTYDSPDTVGIDIATDFHSDRFDQFEIIKRTKLAECDEKQRQKKLDSIRKSLDDADQIKQKTSE